MTGVIRRLFLDKGFGFVESDAGGPSLFFHHTVVQGVGFDALRVGQRVECDSALSDKGRRASFIRPVAGG